MQHQINHPLLRWTVKVVLLLVTLLCYGHLRSQDTAAKRQLEKMGIAYTQENYWHAVNAGDTTVIKYFLIAGMGIGTKNDSGETALLIAVKKKDSSMAGFLLRAGANGAELVGAAISNAPTSKKDFWDKLGSFASVGTVLATLLLGIAGLWFTRQYNRQQTNLLAAQNARNATLSEHENRIHEMEIIEKMIPHLTKDEPTKRVALTIIKVLANAEIASQLAQLNPSEGSIAALETFAANEDEKDKGAAVKALSTMFDSSIGIYQDAAFTALANIFGKLRPGVVKISVIQNDLVRVLGSGLIVSYSGHILTTNYVLDFDPKNTTSEVKVELWDGRTFLSEVIDINAKVGLALLKTSATAVKVTKLATAAPVIGATVMAINPNAGNGPNFSVGMVTAYQVNSRKIDRQNSNFFLFNMIAIGPPPNSTSGGFDLLGAGGGPWLNTDEEVIGIVYSTSSGAERSVHLCISSMEARKYLLERGLTI